MTTVPTNATQVREHLARLPSGPMLCLDTGGNGTPVVFLHAASGNSHTWAYQIPAITGAGYRFIALDYRGVGIPSGAGDASGRIAEVVAQLQLTKFHLLGTAAGGGAALQYTLAHAASVRSLVIANSIGNVQDPDYLAMGKRLRPPAFDALPVELRELGPSYRAENPEGVARWLALSHGEPAAVAEKAQPLPPLKPENAVTWARLEALDIPALLLTGDADLYTPPSVLRLFARHMRQAQTAVIAETGHSSYWESPEVFNRVLLEFLARH